MPDKKSISIALSGGGAKGICHLGVLQAFEEEKIQIDALSGTSSGAMIAALYAYGYSPKEILNMVIKTSFFKLMKFTTTLNGLLTLDNLGKILIKHMPENDFNVLKKPIYIAATELIKGKTVFFTEGELVKPILASCCVPVIFNPLKYKDGIYVDGGILKNLPAEILRENNYDKVIGSDCNPIDHNFALTGVKKLIERSLLLAINGNNASSKEFCNVVIEPPEMKKYSSFDLTKGKEIFEVGYIHTMDMVDEIKEKLNL
jgi:NTE family protein